MFLSTLTMAHSGLIKEIMKSQIKVFENILFSFNQDDLQNMMVSKREKNLISLNLSSSSVTTPLPLCSFS